MQRNKNISKYHWPFIKPENPGIWHKIIPVYSECKIIQNSEIVSLLHNTTSVSRAFNYLLRSILIFWEKTDYFFLHVQHMSILMSIYKWVFLLLNNCIHYEIKYDSFCYANVKRLIRKSPKFNNKSDLQSSFYAMLFPDK